MGLLPHDAHGSRVNESDTDLIQSGTVVVESGTAVVESETRKTNESNSDVIIESDPENISDNVNTETRRPKARGKWRKRVRSLFKVFTCCVKQPDQ